MTEAYEAAKAALPNMFVSGNDRMVQIEMAFDGVFVSLDAIIKESEELDDNRMTALAPNIRNRPLFILDLLLTRLREVEDRLQLSVNTRRNER